MAKIRFWLLLIFTIVIMPVFGSPIALAQTNYAKALNALKEEKFEEAIRLFTKIYEFEENAHVKSMALQFRAKAFVGLNKPKEALRDIEEAIKTTPKKEFKNVYRLSRGMIYLNLESYGAALDDFNYMIEEFPNYQKHSSAWMAYTNRGQTFLKLKEYLNAVKDLKVSLKIINERLKPRERKKLLAIDYFYLGEAYENLEDKKKAKLAFQRARINGSDNPLLTDKIEKYGIDDKYMDVPGYGLKVVSRTKLARIEGKQVVVVSGTIQNTTDEKRTIPELLLSVRGPSHQQLLQKAGTPDLPHLNPSQETQFRFQIDDMPKLARYIEVEFGDFFSSPNP